MPSSPKDAYRNTNQYAPIGERHNKPLTKRKEDFVQGSVNQLTATVRTLRARLWTPSYR